MYVCVCIKQMVAIEIVQWNLKMLYFLLLVDGGSNFVYEFAGSWLWWSELDWKHLVQVEIR